MSMKRRTFSPGLSGSAWPRGGVGRRGAVMPVVACCVLAMSGNLTAAAAGDGRRPTASVKSEPAPATAGQPADVAAVVALARSGNPEALYRLSLLGLAGKLGKPDGPQIEKWLEAAQARGHADAGFVRATMFLKGFHVPADAERAAGLYRQLAEQGHDGAQNAIGQMYFDGRGVPQDYELAAKWFSAAAEKGNAAAQANLALMYAQGNGVAPDTVRAFGLMSSAAQAGRAGAQHNLGWMYQHGVGVAPDEMKAFEWYRRAAESGESRAQYNVALQYLGGKGVSADPVEAVKWLVLAASTTHDQIIRQKAQATLNGVTPGLKSGDFHEGAQAARMWLLRQQWARRSDSPSAGAER